MTNILPFHTSVYGRELNQRSGEVSARVETPVRTHAVGATPDVGGVGDSVAVKAGGQVTAGAVGRVGVSGGLREASSMLQVADAAIVRIDRKMDEMRALAEIAATAPMSKFDRAVINEAFAELMGEINDIVNETEFNGQKPLAGLNQSYSLGGDRALDISIPSMELGKFAPELAGDDLLSQYNSLKAILDVDAAKEKIADVREDIAGWQAEISVAMNGGAGSRALDTIQEFTGPINEGAEISRAISREVVQQALLPGDLSDRDGAPAKAGAAPLEEASNVNPSDESPPHKKPAGLEFSSAADAVRWVKQNDSDPISAKLRMSVTVAADKAVQQEFAQPAEAVSAPTVPDGNPSNFTLFEPLVVLSEEEARRQHMTNALQNMTGVETEGDPAPTGLQLQIIQEAQKQLEQDYANVVKKVSAVLEPIGNQAASTSVKLDALAALAELAESGRLSNDDRAELNVDFQAVRDQLGLSLQGVVEDPSLGLANDNISTAPAARLALENIRAAMESVSN